MKNLVVISPKVAKESAQALATALEADYINPYETKERKFSDYKYMFNYGFSRPTSGTKRKFNKAKEVQLSMDKELCFETVVGCVPTVKITKDKQEAYNWIKQGRIVVARLTTTGSNGEGLVFCSTKKELDLVDAPMYTRYIEHTNELRINIWRGQIISIYDKKIENGFFKFKLLQGFNNQPQAINIAKNLYERIGLDFMGADVLLTAKGNLYFLEANSAPVLFPYTIKRLVNLIKKELV